MAHEIETAAFNWENGAPWHGLGEHLPQNCSVEDMLRIAKIEWEVGLEPVYRAKPEVLAGHPAGFERYPGRNFLVRNDDTRTVLDVVGPDYGPIQNKAVAEFFREFIEADEETGVRKASIEAAGSLRGGRYVWMLAKMNAGFEFQRGDSSEAYLLALKPHQQGQACHIVPTGTRVVCMNTTRIALNWDGQGQIPEKAGAYVIRHNQIFDEKLIQQARDYINATREGIVAFGKMAERLRATPCDRADQIKVLTPVFQAEDVLTVEQMIADPDKLLNRPMKRILSAIKNAPGADPGNLWGLYNGVTYYEDHMVGRSRDIRMASAWSGEGARRKARVLSKITEMAA